MDEGYLRLYADFENYKRNSIEKLARREDKGKIELFISLCDFIDDMMRFENNGQNELLYKKLMKILNGNGFEMFGEIGETFDSDKHDAILVESNQHFPENTIVGLYNVGWKYKGKIVRHAKVVVNKK